MPVSQIKQLREADVRHFIYTHFSARARPPSSCEIAEHFSSSIAQVEKSLTRLADAHQIALAPGSHSIWMAHPFSAIPTNYTTEIGGKKYWGN